MNYAARKDMNALYLHDEGKLFGKGSTKDLTMDLAIIRFNIVYNF